MANPHLGCFQLPSTNAHVLADVRENIDEARRISAWIAMGAAHASLAHLRQRVDTRSNS